MTFLLLKTLSNPKNKLQSDCEEEKWLKHTCQLAGVFFKKYPDAELQGMVQFLLHSLNSETTNDSQKVSDLLLLKELIKNVSGIQESEDIGRNQVNYIAGGRLVSAL